MSDNWFIKINQTRKILRYHEIWNESIIGYSRSISNALEVSAAEKKLFSGAKYKYSVQLILETLAEVDIKKSNQVTKKAVAGGELHKSTNLSYDLYINHEGKVINGAWAAPISERGVDFAWFGAGKGHDSKYTELGGNSGLNFERLRKLFEKAAKPVCKSMFL